MTCILLVEDEFPIREILVEVIGDAGFQIVEAASADIAVKLLKLEGLGLIVTDINLPGRLSGIDLALLARASHPDIPIIFISGRPVMLEQARAVCTPAVYLQKPFSLTTLVGDIQRLASPA
jgi:DNA-binding response OmpR family regulator